MRGEGSTGVKGWEVREGKGRVRVVGDGRGGEKTEWGGRRGKCKGREERKWDERGDEVKYE